MEEAAEFAALREFKLLTLLSKDKKALATARRLGGNWPQQPLATQQPHTCPDRGSRCGRHGDPAATPRGKNARQRRSASRAEARAKQRWMQLNRTWLAVIFYVRLRLRQRERWLARMHMLERAMAIEQQLALEFATSPKRGRDDDGDSTPPATATGESSGGGVDALAQRGAPSPTAKRRTAAVPGQLR